jgi:hypothetical protein
MQHVLLPQLLNIAVYYCSDEGPLSSDGHRCWWILRGITIPLCCPAQNSRYFSTDSTCADGITGPIPGTLTALRNSAAAGSVFPVETNDYSKSDTACYYFMAYHKKCTDWPIRHSLCHRSWVTYKGCWTRKVPQTVRIKWEVITTLHVAQLLQCNIIYFWCRITSILLVG